MVIAWLELIRCWRRRKAQKKCGSANHFASKEELIVAAHAIRSAAPAGSARAAAANLSKIATR
jgi:hypothetical protein